MNTKIYHNPRCSKSRQTLSLLEENGVQPEIVEYLKTPPSSEELSNIISMLNIKPQDLLRKKEDIFKELDLDLDDDKKVIDAMVKHPKLIERPIVVHGDKAKIGRPPEGVLALFE